MKQCPKCQRVFTDETLNYCLDDGSELVYGPASTEQETATWEGGLTSESPTRIQTAEVKSPSHFQSSLLVNRKYMVVIALLLAVPVAGYFAYRYSEDASEKQIGTIAVLPIVNETANPDLEYLSDGLTESLIASLSKLPQLSVKARSSVFRYKGTDVDLKKAGRDLGVEALLTGRMAQRGDDVRVDIELVESATEKVLWKADYHRLINDVAALETELSRDISAQLRSKLAGSSDPGTVGLHTDNADAYELYLKGRYYATGSEERIRQAIFFYDRAIAADPNYALAYVGQARAFMDLGGVFGYMTPKETFPKARQALEKALAINGGIAEAHAAFASYYLLYEWNWKAAKQEFDTALKLDPDDSELHASFGTYLEATGQFDDAVRERELARKLDPLNPSTTADVGYPLYYARRQDEAIDKFEKGLAIDPNFAWSYLWIGQSRLEQKQFIDAIAQINHAIDISGGNSTRMIATRGFAYAVAGRRADAEKVLDDLGNLSRQKYVSPFFFSIIYAGLGDKDLAFDYLQRAVDERHPYLVLINVDPFFDNVRDDPRFAEAVSKIGIPH